MIDVQYVWTAGKLALRVIGDGRMHGPLKGGMEKELANQ
jgi:hypothetical protein